MMTPETTKRMLIGVTLTGCALALMLGASLWTQLVQRKPQIIAVELPVPNANADASGVTFQAWQKRGAGLTLAASRNLDRDWKPVPVATFRPGETVWVRRDSCYIDKASVQGVVTEVIGTGAAAGRRYTYPPMDPPKRTVPVVSAAPERPDGPAGPFGHCAAYNYPYVLPPLTALVNDSNAANKTGKMVVQTKGDDGKPLWEPLPSTWILRTSVRFIWTWFLPRVPAHHPDAWITVVP